MKYYSIVKKSKSYLLFFAPVILFAFFGFKTDIEIQDQETDLKASIKRGAALYQANCVKCHMAQGQGLPSVFPPLENSKNLKDKAYLIKVVKNGITTATKVKGLTYSTPMAAIDLTDKEISDVLNYIRNSWGNSFEPITPLEVGKVLQSVKKQ